MIIKLKDGVGGGSLAIHQTAEYLGRAPGLVADAPAELLKLVQLQVPTQWRCAPLAVVWPRAYGDLTAERFAQKRFPHVLTVGWFSSFKRGDALGRIPKTTYLHIAWVQTSFEPLITTDNAEALLNLNWDLALRTSRVWQYSTFGTG